MNYNNKASFGGGFFICYLQQLFLASKFKPIYIIAEIKYIIMRESKINLIEI